MQRTAAYWIDRLALQSHPEGGYYRETYRAPLEIAPDGFQGKRSVSTAIYFLLAGDEFSALHRIRSDEMWHFYAGSSLIVHAIRRDGVAAEFKLGNDLESGEQLQAVVKAGDWFGSRLQDSNSYALVGCTVAPGFDFADFEMGKRAQLLKTFPQHAELIKSLTRD